MHMQVRVHMRVRVHIVHACTHAFFFMHAHYPCVRACSQVGRWGGRLAGAVVVRAHARVQLPRTQQEGEETHERREEWQLGREIRPFTMPLMTLAATSIDRTSALLGGASCGAAPTRCRTRRPPSSPPSPASPASSAAMRDRSCEFSVRSSATSLCSGANMRWHTAKGHVASCAALSASSPDHAQPASAAAHARGRCGQPCSCAATSPRVVASPQCVHAAGSAAIRSSWLRDRIAWLSGPRAMRHSGQRRGARRLESQEAQKTWPSRHWCCCPSCTSRQTGHSRRFCTQKKENALV